MSADLPQRVGGGTLKQVPLHIGEVLLDEQSARYRKRDIHLARGKLFVTDSRLIFCPERFAILFRDDPLVIVLGEIAAIGRIKRNPWFQTLVMWGMGSDSWFIDVSGRRHWFDVGQGWNQLWLPKFAERIGLPITNES